MLNKENEIMVTLYYKYNCMKPSEAYLSALLKGNRAECSQIVQQFLASNSSLLDLYEEVMKPALYEVGRMWEANMISVAREHIATAITEGIMNELYATISPTIKSPYRVILTCVENEPHQVGVKMVSDIFEARGWDAYFVGSGIPPAEILASIKEFHPHLIAISLSVFFNYKGLVTLIKLIRDHHPEMPLLVGGQAVRHLSQHKLPPFENVTILDNLYLLETYISNFSSSQNS